MESDSLDPPDVVRVRWLLWADAVILAGFLLAACGGSSIGAVRPNTTGPSGVDTRLPTLQARRITSICRRSETPEDQNIIVQFANRGYSIAGPQELAALKAASRDVLRERTRVRAALPRRSAPDSGLVGALGAQAHVLDRAARFVQVHAEEAQLLAVLHRRAALAEQAGVVGCAGSERGSLRARAPAS